MTACSATTRKGEPCQSPAMHDGNGLCHAHARAEGFVKVPEGFGGPQPGSGRPRNVGPIEVIRERIEANVDLVVEPFFRILGDELRSDDEKASWSLKLLERGWGRPGQRVELTGADGGAITIADLAAKAREENPE